MKRLLTHLLKLKIFSANFCDLAADQYRQMIDNRLFQLEFEEFDRQKTRLDDFFFKVLDIRSHKELQSVVKLVLTLSHGQAAVERGFSINK